MNDLKSKYTYWSSASVNNEIEKNEILKIESRVKSTLKKRNQIHIWLYA